MAIFSIQMGILLIPLRWRARLPTEAEWEFAARGGNESHNYARAGGNNVENVAWYKLNASSKTHEVGGKAPNELGLYDMSGNVWEWVSDRYGLYGEAPLTNPFNGTEGTLRVNRGGSWIDCQMGVRIICREVPEHTPTSTLDLE